MIVQWSDSSIKPPLESLSMRVADVLLDRFDINANPNPATRDAVSNYLK
jgi:hypothetical protein